MTKLVVVFVLGLVAFVTPQCFSSNFPVDCGSFCCSPDTTCCGNNDYRACCSPGENHCVVQTGSQSIQCCANTTETSCAECGYFTCPTPSSDTKPSIFCCDGLSDLACCRINNCGVICSTGEGCCGTRNSTCCTTVKKTKKNSKNIKIEIHYFI